jgi:hypothetical protein
MRFCSACAAVLLVSTLACGGHSSLTPATVSGPYEFVVTSNVNGSVTLVETNLSASGNQSSASGPSQVQVLTLQKKIWYVNGVCTESAPGQNSISASVSGNNINITFNEGGYQFSGAGSITGSAINGNYLVTDSPCPNPNGPSDYPPGTDQGGFVGNVVPMLAGTFSGSLNLPDGTDNASLTLTENSDTTLSVSAQLTGGVDNGTFPFTGYAVGNVMFVSGTVNGQQLNLFGYYDRTGAYTGMPGSILVFNYDTFTSVGLLLAQ